MDLKIDEEHTRKVTVNFTGEEVHVMLRDKVALKAHMGKLERDGSVTLYDNVSSEVGVSVATEDDGRKYSFRVTLIEDCNKPRVGPKEESAE